MLIYNQNNWEETNVRTNERKKQYWLRKKIERKKEKRNDFKEQLNFFANLLKKGKRIYCKHKHKLCHRKRKILENIAAFPFNKVNSILIIKDTISPLQLFKFTNVIRRFRLPLWIGYFIYFKFTRVSSIIYQLLHL